MKTFPWKEFLRKHPIFATVRDEKRIDGLLDDQASWEHAYDTDEIILRQGDLGASVFVIGAGSAEAVLERRDGAPVSLSVMRRGDVFGEMAFLEHRGRSATVRAKEPCTVLEISGADFEHLMAEYPDIEFKLLLRMSERLRNAGEQVLGLQLGNVDEKLKVFNLKLDTEHKLVDCALRAAQAMFDQTKLRADEVITSAERSRDRLQKWIALVGAFAGVAITMLGAFGFKQIWDVSQMATEVRNVKDQALGGHRESTKALDEIKKAHVDIQTAHKLVSPLAMTLNDMKAPLTEIVRDRFMTAVQNGQMPEAKRAYAVLKELGGGDEVQTAVDGLERGVFEKEPPKHEATPALLDELIKDCQQLSGKSEVVRAYRLRIAYSILTGQNKSARQPFYKQLHDFIEKHPEAKLESSIILSRVLEKIGDDRADELRSLGELTTRKI